MMSFIDVSLSLDWMVWRKKIYSDDTDEWVEWEKV